MTFAAEFEDKKDPKGTAERRFIKTLETVRTHLVKKWGFQVERVYVSKNSNPKLFLDGTPVSPEIKDAMLDGTVATSNLIAAATEGRLVIAHRGRAGTSGWKTPSFKSDDICKVTGPMPSMFFSVNCNSGKFDYSKTGNTFAEVIMQNPGCAPSLIAATRLSHTFLNDDLTKALFDWLWPGLLPTFPVNRLLPTQFVTTDFGDLLNYTKSYLPISGTAGKEWIKDHFEIYHVIGDPTLESGRMSQN